MKLEDMPDFIPGMRLCEDYYWEAVRPILDKHFSQVSHSTARLDYGSDVMGFDTPQSRDHAWGPRAMLFLSDDDYEQYRDSISEVMARELPLEFRGYPTNFDAPFTGEGLMQPIKEHPVNHWIAVTTMATFFKGYLGVDPSQPIREIDWLTIPQQSLRTVASGQVFHDELDQLETVREHLRWYPRDVWLYLLANQWRRIDQEEPFVARCGDVEDELGSRIVASRLVTDVIKLCFLMERQYLPYYKWLGTAFGRLACAAQLLPIFQRVLNSQNWRERETHLSEAYLVLMEMHNSLELTPSIEPKLSNFHDRPYLVPQSSRFVDALLAAIQSETVRNLPQHVGAISQFIDSTDVGSNLDMIKKLKVIYNQES